MRVLIIVISILAVVPIFGQQQEIPFINSLNIRGVYNTGEEVVAVSFIEHRKVDNKDIYQVSYFNDSHEKLAFEVDHRSSLVQVSSFKGNTYFVFNNPVIKSYEIIGLDKARNVTSILGLVPELTVEYGQVYRVENNQAGNVFVFRSYAIYESANSRNKVVESGTEIVSYDKNLKQIGALKMKYENEKRPVITGFTPIKEGFVLSVETRDYKAKEYTLALHIFTNELKETGSYELTDESTYFPTEIISDEGQIVIAGYNLKGSIFDSKGAEGLFVTVVKMDGSLVNTSKYSWELLKGKLGEGDRGDFIFSGKMNVLVEKIRPTANGYQIICESYANNSGKTVVEFALRDGAQNRMVVVNDFVIFETALDGSLSAVSIVEKEPMNIEINASGYMNKASQISFAYHMKKHKAFPFRSIKENTISFVNYKNKVGYLCTVDIITGEITQGSPIVITPTFEEEVNELNDEVVANSKALTKLDNLENKMNNSTEKLDKLGNKLDYGIEKVDVVFNPSQRSNTGIFTFDSGETLSYYIYPDRYSIFFETLK